MSYLHSACPICETLGDEHYDDAYRRVDRTHCERINNAQTLDEDSTVHRGEILTSELKENINTDHDQCSLQIRYDPISLANVGELAVCSFPQTVESTYCLGKVPKISLSQPSHRGYFGTPYTPRVFALL